ncbi:hypothetical protein LINPERHAP1_LOCUS27191 [Linum perenne]
MESRCEEGHPSNQLPLGGQVYHWVKCPRFETQSHPQPINRVLNRNLQVNVQHIYREANRVADLLAHLSHCKLLGTHFLDSCPPDIKNALASDCIGVSSPV